MQRRRPTALVIIAVLNLILGTIGILTSAAGFAIVGSGGQERFMTWIMGPEFERIQKQTNGYTTPELFAYVDKQLPGYQTIQLAKGGADLLLSLILIAAGLGLLRMASWSRPLAISYALLDIAINLLVFAWMATFFSPTVDGFFNEVSGNLTPQQELSVGISKMSVKLGPMVAPAFVLLYPVIVLVCMFLPSVRQAFRNRITTEVERPSEPHSPAGATPPMDSNRSPASAEQSSPGAEFAAQQPVRRDTEPHRGSLILALGVVSQICTFVFAPVGIILGILAWIMGSRDLRRIRAGEMDPSGEGTTLAGKIGGIIGFFMSLVVTIFMGLYIVFIIVVLISLPRIVPTPPPKTVPAAGPVQKVDSAEPASSDDKPAPMPPARE